MVQETLFARGAREPLGGDVTGTVCFPGGGGAGGIPRAPTVSGTNTQACSGPTCLENSGEEPCLRGPVSPCLSLSFSVIRGCTWKREMKGLLCWRRAGIGGQGTDGKVSSDHFSHVDQSNICDFPN